MDVIGVSEVRRYRECIYERKSGNIFMHTEGQKGLYGVGFIVSNKLKSCVQEFKAFSCRIAKLVLEISKAKRVTIVQVYAPTMDASEEVKDSFYSELHAVLAEIKRKNNCIICMGDFNGRVGQRLEGEENIMGTFTYGQRNSGGERIINLTFSQRLHVGNSYFKKGKNDKWTWISPKGKKHEIDFFLINRLSLLKDISFARCFNFDSDHRMIKLELYIGIFKKERPFKVKKNQVSSFNEAQSTLFQNQLAVNLSGISVIGKLDCVQKTYDRLIGALESAMQNIALSKEMKNNKLSQATLDLLKARKELKRREEQTQDERGRISLLNKEIRNGIKRDLKLYKQAVIEGIMAGNKSMRQIRNRLSGGKQWMLPLLNASKEKVSDRKEIMLMVTKYFRNLYECHNKSRSFLENTRNRLDGEVPPVTTTEIIHAVRALKKNKAPGPDGIQNEILIAGHLPLSAFNH